MQRGRGDSAIHYPASLSSPRVLGGAEFWGSIQQRTPLGGSVVLCPMEGPLKGELKRKWEWPGVVQPFRLRSRVFKAGGKPGALGDTGKH